MQVVLFGKKVMSHLVTKNIPFVLVIDHDIARFGQSTITVNGAILSHQSLYTKVPLPLNIMMSLLGTLYTVAEPPLVVIVLYLTAIFSYLVTKFAASVFAEELLAYSLGSTIMISFILVASTIFSSSNP